jgi:predicted TIM-barrel fold metal-dependent hydrolase
MLKHEIRHPKFISYLEHLKKKYNLKIVDAHVHPFDIMSINHIDDYIVAKENGELEMKKSASNAKKFSKSTTKKIEAYRLGSPLKLGFSLRSRFTPSKFINYLKAHGHNLSEEKLLDEMDKSFIDYIACLPVAPWASTKDIKKNYNHIRFLHLGSLDIQGLKIDEIENNIKQQIDLSHIIGLKIHPSLQNFKPQPKDNPPDIRNKLEKIYKIANKYKLYLHFHGGKQSYGWLNLIRYGQSKRMPNNGQFKDFFNKKGESQIFDIVKVPVIISHLGHFNSNRLQKNLILKAVGRNKNLFFDTSGVEPAKIKKLIELIGSHRLIFGSDALYNHMFSSVYHLYEAVHLAKSQEGRDAMMVNILGKNYSNRIHTLTK